LEERKQTIADDLDGAKKSREDAEELVTQRGDELKQSADEIRKLKQASKRDAESQASDILKEAKHQEKRILKETEEQLEQEKAKTLKELEGELAEMVSSLSEKFLSGKIDDKKDTELIKEIITKRSDK
jgi:F-type H+-transporting ATPase subunit b